MFILGTDAYLSVVIRGRVRQKTERVNRGYTAGAVFASLYERGKYRPFDKGRALLQRNEATDQIFIFENNPKTRVASWYQLPSSLYDKYYYVCMLYKITQVSIKHLFNLFLSLYRFLIDIQNEEKQTFIDSLRESRSIRGMIDGATDTSNSEDEIVYVKYYNHIILSKVASQYNVSILSM